MTCARITFITIQFLVYFATKVFQQITLNIEIYIRYLMVRKIRSSIKTNINFMHSRFRKNLNGTRITPSAMACHFDFVVSDEIKIPKALKRTKVLIFVYYPGRLKIVFH